MKKNQLNTQHSQLGPIGLFDSGIGGLSITRAVQQTLPNTPLIYVADHAHAPYGGQPEQLIRERGAQIIQWLINQGAQAIVVACNTATVMAIGDLRRQFTVPIIGVEPGIKPALVLGSAQSKQRKPGLNRKPKIAVLATQNTVQGKSFRRLVSKYATQFGDQAPVILQACPGFAERVESGDWESEAAQTQIRQVITPLIKTGVETLVLGCTHYIFLKPLILKAAGKSVQLIDTSQAVARQVRKRLCENIPPNTEAPNAQNAQKSDLSSSPSLAKYRFYSTQLNTQTQAIVRKLWPEVNQISPISL